MHSIIPPLVQSKKFQLTSWLLGCRSSRNPESALRSRCGRVFQKDAASSPRSDASASCRTCPESDFGCRRWWGHKNSALKFSPEILYMEQCSVKYTHHHFFMSSLESQSHERRTCETDSFLFNFAQFLFFSMPKHGRASLVGTSR